MQYSAPGKYTCLNRCGSCERRPLDEQKHQEKKQLTSYSSLWVYSLVEKCETTILGARCRSISSSVSILPLRTTPCEMLISLCSVLKWSIHSSNTGGCSTRRYNYEGDTPCKGLGAMNERGFSDEKTHAKAPPSSTLISDSGALLRRTLND